MGESLSSCVASRHDERPRVKNCHQPVDVPRPSAVTTSTSTAVRGHALYKGGLLLSLLTIAFALALRGQWQHIGTLLCFCAVTQILSKILFVKVPSSGNPDLSPENLDMALVCLEKQWSAKIASYDGAVPLKRCGTHDSTIIWNVEGSSEHVAELRRTSSEDLRRFIAARQGNLSAALHLGESVARWRAAVRPSTVTLQYIPNAIAQGCWRYAGWSKCGYPIIAIDASLWAPSRYSGVDEYTRYVAYLMEIVVTKRMGQGVTKFITLFELSGFSTEMVRPIAMRCLVNLAKIIQDVNAERVAAIYFLNTNVAFRMSWHLIAPLVDSRTRNKIHWPKASENRTVLGRVIPLDQLEERFGGDLKGSYAPLTGKAQDDAGSESAPAFNPAAPDPLRVL